MTIGPIELFLVSASVHDWYVLSCLWDEQVSSRYLSGPLPYVRIHITADVLGALLNKTFPPSSSS